MKDKPCLSVRASRTGSLQGLAASYQQRPEEMDKNAYLFIRIYIIFIHCIESVPAYNYIAVII